MDNEKLRKEFEAYFSRAILPATNDFSGYTKEALEWSFKNGYLAAAQSRDELIGKLCRALEDAQKLKTLGYNICHCERDNGKPHTFIEQVVQIENDSKQALADAKAQGYGE